MGGYNKSMTSDESILNKFNNEVTHHESYRKLERFLSRFAKTGQGYPYGLFKFDDFENEAENHRFLLAMRRFIDTVIDKEKLDLLVYTLLEIIRQDTSITIFCTVTSLYRRSIFSAVLFRKSRHSSWGPLLGGLFLCIGFLMIPDNPYRHLWWIAFFIDWGCIPGIIFTIIAHIIRIYKNKKTQ